MKDMIVVPNKKGAQIYSRQYFVEMGRKGGIAGKGKSKKRKTSFNSKSGKAAINKRWSKKQ
jgi:hypothetical protein